MKANNTKKFTFLHRSLHWSITLSMFILFFTGFLRMEWMNKKAMIKIIENQLTPENISVNKNILNVIAKKIQAPMWEWHEVTAYVLLALFIIRVVYMLTNGFRFENPFQKRQPLKTKLQGLIYLAVYLLIFSCIITGFYLKWGDGTYKSQMETIHKWALYWFPIFVIIHFLGILIGEYTNKKGIASNMISGKF